MTRVRRRWQGQAASQCDGDGGGGQAKGGREGANVDMNVVEADVGEGEDKASERSLRATDHLQTTELAGICHGAKVIHFHNM